MDFFESQDRARRKTSQLLVLFVLAVVVMNAAIYLVAVSVFGYVRSNPDTVHWWQPQILVIVALATNLVIAFGSLYKTFQLRRGGGATVATMLGGRRLLPNSESPAERQLLNVVEEMALASGVPVPAVYVLSGERGINAFAAGYTVGDAVIGVNRGTLEYLSRDELQGVIAHEFSHILHGDMRLNLRLIGLLHGILILSIIGYYFMRFGGGSSRHSDRGRNGGQIALLGLAVFVIGYVGLFFARLIKAAVSRQREYLADASAVQFTRNPDGLAGALKKIGGLATGSRVESPEAESASHMFFGSCQPSWLGGLSTHPPLLDRIRKLDPNFQGEYPRIVERKPPQQTPVAGQDQQKSPFEAFEKTVTAGTKQLPFDPLVLLATIGTPTQDHVDHARRLLAALPEELHNAIHDMFSARSVVMAMLLDEDTEIRSAQLKAIADTLGPAVAQETERLAAAVARRGRAARLPLIEIAHSTLRGLSADQFQAFKETVHNLIRADKKIDVFEFTLTRSLLLRLSRHFQRTKPPVVGYLSIRGIAPEASNLLSTLVHLGHSNAETARQAFELANVAFAEDVELEFRDQEECSLEVLNSALDKLAGSAPAIKERTIRAACVAIAADGHVTPNEAEMVRAIADTLDCPVPPLYGGTKVAV